MTSHDIEPRGSPEDQFIDACTVRVPQLTRRSGVAVVGEGNRINEGDIFPDTALVRAFMDAIVQLNDGFIRAEDEMFKRYFAVLVEGEKIAPFVMQSMSYESVQEGSE